MADLPARMEASDALDMPAIVGELTPPETAPAEQNRVERHGDLLSLDPLAGVL